MGERERQAPAGGPGGRAQNILTYGPLLPQSLTESQDICSLWSYHILAPLPHAPCFPIPLLSDSSPAPQEHRFVAIVIRAETQFKKVQT